MVLAAVMPGKGKPIEVQEFPEPDLEADSGLMRVELSEVCGTDVYLRDSRLVGVPYPIIPGHVSVGRLDKIRGSMFDIMGKPLAEGDRITFLDVHRTCHACWHCCVAKASTRCPHRKVYGITYGVEQDGLTGGWSEKLYLKPGTLCIRVDGVDDEAFMAGGCSLPTALHATDRAEIQIGDTVLVLGSGPVGLSSVVFAKMAGALKVLCIGAPAHRLEIAKHVGADQVLDIETQSMDARMDWIAQHTQGRGADVTIEATGAPAAVVQSMRFTRDAGRVVVVGQYTDHGETPFNPHLDLNKKHLDIRGCWGSDFSHFYRGVQIMADADRAAPWKHIEMDRYGLASANEALEAVQTGRIIKALIDPWKSD
ncbi:MAG: zinc-binding dehydrogenase [Planctomycetota bacterium]|nr:zinc-binding dehydrogenase [Planctomycetota bacterium]